MKKFGLVAHPVDHSLSPVMWKVAFLELGLDYTYEAIDVLSGELAERFDILKKEYSGLSISMPHKEAIIALLDEISKEAKMIGAANTVTIRDGKTFGDNTDWIGVRETLAVIPNLKEKLVLVCGAGGAARSAIYALNMIGIKPFVFNRSPDKLEKLNGNFQIEVINDINKLKSIDIFINATSIGLNEKDIFPISDEQLKNISYVFDMIYSTTDLSERAKRYGIKIISGKEMLLYQAVRQFKIFTGLDAPIEIMKKAIT